MLLNEKSVNHKHMVFACRILTNVYAYGYILRFIYVTHHFFFKFHTLWSYSRLFVWLHHIPQICINYPDIVRAVTTLAKKENALIVSEREFLFKFFLHFLCCDQNNNKKKNIKTKAKASNNNKIKSILRVRWRERKPTAVAAWYRL